MVQLDVRHRADRHRRCSTRCSRRGGIHGGSHPIADDIEFAPLTYGRLVTASFALGACAGRAHAAGRARRRAAADVARVGRHVLRAAGHGRVPAMLNFSTGAGRRPRRPARPPRSARSSPRGGSSRRPSSSAGRGARGEGDDPLSRGPARRDRPCASSCRALFGAPPDRRGRRRGARQRAGRGAVHLRIGRHAEGRRAEPPQPARQPPPARRAWSTSSRATSCSTRCRCSTASG